MDPGEWKLCRGDDVLVERLEIAASKWRRARGLLGRTSLDPGNGLYLRPCSSVHTFFMRFPIDLIFVSSDLRVVRFVRNVPPNRIAMGGRGAYSVIEVASGWLPADAVEAGDALALFSRQDAKDAKEERRKRTGEWGKG